MTFSDRKSDDERDWHGRYYSEALVRKGGAGDRLLVIEERTASQCRRTTKRGLLMTRVIQQRTISFNFI
jgi:hypothetical protein